MGMTRANSRYHGCLSETAREAKNQYSRDWRKNNPDKVKEYNQRYWERQALKRAEKSKA